MTEPASFVATTPGGLEVDSTIGTRNVFLMRSSHRLVDYVRNRPDGPGAAGTTNPLVPKLEGRYSIEIFN